MPANRWNLPDLGLGVGLRTKHFAHVLEARPEVGFFEALTENHLDTGGRPIRVLDEVASRYPVVLHGVSLSIGSADPLDLAYVAKVRALADRTRAVMVSDHVCWTGVMGRNTHDLLPLPASEEALRHVVPRIRRAQDALGRPLVLENASTYLELASSTMSEPEFLARMADEADCGLLLDVNNVYVSCFNHGWDAEAYVDAIPPERVAYFHLAGHTSKGTHVIDTHSDHVADAVWALYARAVRRIGPRSTLLEWDADIPAFEVLEAELRKARACRDEALRDAA
jgi:hypothetical protein